MPLYEVSLNRLSPMMRTIEPLAIEPPEVLLNAPSPVKPTGHLHPVVHRNPDGPEVEGLVMQRAEAEPVVDLVRSTVGVPVDVGGFQADRQAV